jgi:elongation factor G
VVRYALSPKAKTDEAKLAQKLHDIAEEDIALKIEHDPVTKEALLGGCGPVHIEATLEKLRRAGIEVELHPPRIPYLETIRGRTKNVEGKHKKQTGGKGQYGVCYIDMEPAPRGSRSPCSATSATPRRRRCRQMRRCCAAPRTA